MKRPSTKTRIARTARRLFLQKGIEGVSMRGIAGEVRISATAIYRHFRDKDDLLRAIAEEGARLFSDYLWEAKTASTPRERLREMAARYLDFALEHPHHYDFLFLLPRKRIRRFPDDFKQRDDLALHIVSGEVEKGMRLGQLIVDDPLQTALSIWAHCHGLVALQRAGRFGHDEEEVRVQYMRSIDRMLTGLTVR